MYTLEIITSKIFCVEYFQQQIQFYREKTSQELAKLRGLELIH